MEGLSRTIVLGASWQLHQELSDPADVVRDSRESQGLKWRPERGCGQEGGSEVGVGRALAGPEGGDGLLSPCPRHSGSGSSSPEAL